METFSCSSHCRAVAAQEVCVLVVGSSHHRRGHEASARPQSTVPTGMIRTSGSRFPLYTPGSGLHFCPSCKAESKAELHLLCLSCSLQKLKQKNQQLKQIMDQLRNLIWEINSMLAIRSWDATGQEEVRAGLLTVNRSPQTGWEHGNDDALHLQRSRRGGRRWWWQKVFCLPRWDLSRKHILICSYLNRVNSRTRKAFLNGP